MKQRSIPPGVDFAAVAFDPTDLAPTALARSFKAKVEG